MLVFGRTISRVEHPAIYTAQESLIYLLKALGVVQEERTKSRVEMKARYGKLYWHGVWYSNLGYAKEKLTFGSLTTEYTIDNWSITVHSGNYEKVLSLALEYVTEKVTDKLKKTTKIVKKKRRKKR